MTNSFKTLPEEERPRERFARYGAEALSTIELLAILLGSGTKDKSVLQLAADLLAHFGSLHSLLDASLEELTLVKGIGPAKAILLKAAFDLSQRAQDKRKKALLDAPQKVYELIAPDLSSQKTELLMIILRDVKRRCLHREVISKGTLTELLVHPREVFHPAIRHRAHNLIIAHNHPSGDPTPSVQDLEMTQVLANAGTLLGIELSDHLIVGKQTYVSLFQKGLLRKGAIY